MFFNHTTPQNPSRCFEALYKLKFLYASVSWSVPFILTSLLLGKVSNTAIKRSFTVLCLVRNLYASVHCGVIFILTKKGYKDNIQRSFVYYIVLWFTEHSIYLYIYQTLCCNHGTAIGIPKHFILHKKLPFNNICTFCFCIPYIYWNRLCQIMMDFDLKDDFLI